MIKLLAIIAIPVLLVGCYEEPKPKPTKEVTIEVPNKDYFIDKFNEIQSDFLD